MSRGRNEAFFRRIQAQKERKRRRRWIGLGLVSAALVYVTVFGDAGWLAVRDAQRNVEEKQAAIDALEAETAADSAALAELEVEGGEALEATARELYRMQQPGESVYHLVGGSDEEGADAP